MHSGYGSYQQRSLRNDEITAVWFFFFQAEDGIRDLTVTGVQTCALPILMSCSVRFGARSVSVRNGVAPREKVMRSFSIMCTNTTGSQVSWRTSRAPRWSADRKSVV